MNRLIFLSCLALATLCNHNAIANSPDWLFARSSFTHSPRTGARTAQYAAAAPVEGLPDPRATMSRYWNTRTQIVGADGSSDTIYEVHSFGDAQGVNNARWERDFDAWKDAARIAGPFWAGAYWPSGGGPPAPGADYYNQGYGTGGGYGFGGVYGGGFGGGFGGGYGFGGGFGGGPYTGFGPNGFFGGPGVPFGVSPYGYGFAPGSAFPQAPYPHPYPRRPGHGGGPGYGGGGGSGHGGGTGYSGGGSGHGGKPGYGGQGHP